MWASRRKAEATETALRNQIATLERQLRRAIDEGDNLTQTVDSQAGQLQEWHRQYRDQIAVLAHWAGCEPNYEALLARVVRLVHEQQRRVSETEPDRGAGSGSEGGAGDHASPCEDDPTPT